MLQPNPAPSAVRRSLARLAPFGLLAMVLLLAAPPPATAAGQDLTGRMAPDLVFPAGMNGIDAGEHLSALRGRVVWIKFVLRDCPHCRATLPQAQDLHERWGGSGLVVLVVVHQYLPDQIRPFLQQFGYTFPVASDPTGALAQRFGVQSRPTDYVIGVDGRVKASNGAPEDVLRRELAQYRLERLGAVPAGLDAVREAVWRWDLGGALRLVAAADRSAAEVAALHDRLVALARDDVAAWAGWADTLARKGRVPDARAVLERLGTLYAGTEVESDVQAARQAFQARYR